MFDKYMTGVTKIKKIRSRQISIVTWNVRTLKPAGKLEELMQTMNINHWNILGLCEMHWKTFSEMVVSRSSGLAKMILQGTVKVKR